MTLTPWDFPARQPDDPSPAFVRPLHPHRMANAMREPELEEAIRRRLNGPPRAANFNGPTRVRSGRHVLPPVARSNSFLAIIAAFIGGMLLTAGLAQIVAWVMLP